MSREAVIQNENDVNNHELITIYLLSEKQVQSEVNTTVGNLNSSASVRINSFMDYLSGNESSKFLYFSSQYKFYDWSGMYIFQSSFNILY